MANFLFYKYHFEQTDDRSLFSQETGELVTESFLNEQFQADLKTKASKHIDLNLYAFKADRKGEQTSEQFANEILQYDEGIVFLDVRNNKVKKVIPIDQTEPKDVGHFPYCGVIIDTRPDSMAILVQQKSDAFKNSDEVIGLISDYCTRELGLVNLNYRFVSEKRLCVGSIWDIVKIRTVNDQDRVKSLCIKIDGKKPNENNAVDSALQMILEKLSAPEGELKLTSDDNAKKILDETKEDVRNTVDLLIDNNYRMKIGFEKSGTVEYGKQAEAVYGIADNVCEEFRTGSRSIIRDDGTSGYNLELWLNTIMPEDGAHTYIQPEDRKKNGRRKK